MQIQTVTAVDVAVDRIGVGGNDGQTGDQLHTLTDHIGQAGLVGVVVIGVKRKHTGGHLVHDGGGGGFHQNILVKTGGESGIAIQQGSKAIQLLGGGQVPEEEQIAALGKAEALLLYEILAKVAHTVAAVIKATVHGGALTLVNDIAVGIADTGHARHHAGAVGLAQAALDAVVIKGSAGDLVLLLRNGNELLQDLSVLCIKCIVRV